ncbi:MAG: RES domain-containing protein [Burkholderiaceae bacterium]
MTIVYRASRRPDGFDPLDASASVGRGGWRYNDRDTPILYAASVQSLAILEVVARPGWDAVEELAIFPIDVPDGTIAPLEALGIRLPSNWNNRPAAGAARRIGAQFLQAVDAARRLGDRLCGVLVPSVISTVDRNVLLDPRQVDTFAVGSPALIPFDWLTATGT